MQRINTVNAALSMGLLASSQLLHTHTALAQAAANAPPAAAFPNTDASTQAPASPPPDSPPSDSPPSDSPALSPAAPDAPSGAAAPLPVPATPPPAAAPPVGTGSATFAPLAEAPGKQAVKRPAPKGAPPSSARSPGPPRPGAEPPLASPPSATSDVKPSEAESGDEPDGLFGPFRIGFLIGTGLPDLLSLGGAIKVTRYFGAGVNVGLIPTVQLSLYGDATISFHEYDVYGRIYPFGGAFFLGAGLGYAKVEGTLSNHYALTPEESAVTGLASPVQIDSRGSVRTMVLTPKLGLLKTFSSGFSIGVDVGAQIPVAPSTVDYATHVPPGVPVELVTPNDDKVRSTLNTVGRTTLPTFDFKIGWLL